MASQPVKPAHSNPLLAAARLLALVGLTFFLYPFYYLHYRLTPRDRRYPISARWVHAWAVMACAVFGIRVRRHGPPPPPGALLAANHVSYADILALSSAIPCLFTPKSEIKSWPLAGFFVRTTGHPFVTRARGRDIIKTTRSIERRLRAGTHVVVFLEGTTTGGDRLLPFKPALLGAAESIQAPVVPVALRWSSRHPRVAVQRDIAYWGRHVIGPHVWRLVGLRGTQVDITFHEPMRLDAGERRRLLADRLRRRIAATLDLPLALPETNPPQPASEGKETDERAGET
ncbi:MAG TPA: lysophospholipid acyltransferase family protein [Candidatus Sumerlaeota bacterium]|nr:lysophospholipid acyltransferase family protein [Candidatus Sumerlaeota bacterium]HPK00956.1 lysophospholipid acyltransferase family protein [Candidatus Sumerlaeota bacterium]